MNEHAQEKHSHAEAEETDVLTILKKIQQHMVYLEKKIDSLLQQSPEKSFAPRNFQKPFRSFDRPRPRHRGDFQPRGDFDRPRSRDDFKPRAEGEGGAPPKPFGDRGNRRPFENREGRPGGFQNRKPRWKKDRH